MFVNDIELYYLQILQCNTGIFPQNFTKRVFISLHTNCIWRKTKIYSLQGQHKLFVHRATIQAFLPPHLLEYYWFKTIEDADDIPENITPLTRYRKLGRFRQQTQWNHFTTEDHCTNNNLEGFHSNPKKLVNHQHPNIYVLI